MKGKKVPPPTYKQTLMELSLLARNAGQLADDAARDDDVRRCFIIITTVAEMLQKLVKEGKK